jgi:tape measure domain-containing protein
MKTFNLSAIFSLTDRISQPLNNISNRLSGIGATVQSLNSKFSSLNNLNLSRLSFQVKNLKGHFSDLHSSIGSLGSRLAGIGLSAGFAFKTLFVNPAAAASDTMRMYENKYGKEEGLKQYNQAKTIGDKSILDTNEAARYYSMFKDIGYNPENKVDTSGKITERGVLQKLLDGMSKAGLNAENTKSVIRQLYQSASRGKLQGDEKNILAEQGMQIASLLVPYMREVEKKNITSEQIDELISKGDFNKQWIERLINATGYKADGMAEAAGNTYSGKIANIQSQWETIASKVMINGGILDLITQKLSQVLQWLESISEAQFQAFASSVKSIIEEIWAGILVVKDFISSVAEVVGGFKNLTILFAGFVILGPVISTFGALLGIISSVVGIVGLLGTGITGATLAVGGLAAAFSAAAGALAGRTIYNALPASTQEKIGNVVGGTVDAVSSIFQSSADTQSMRPPTKAGFMTRQKTETNVKVDVNLSGERPVVNTSAKTDGNSVQVNTGRNTLGRK